MKIEKVKCYECNRTTEFTVAECLDHQEFDPPLKIKVNGVEEVITYRTDLDYDDEDDIPEAVLCSICNTFDDEDFDE